MSSGRSGKMRRALLLVAPLALIAAIYGIAQIPASVNAGLTNGGTSLTNGTVPKATGAGTLADSIITDDGQYINFPGRHLFLNAKNYYGSTGGNFRASATSVFGWSVAADSTIAPDTGISRSAAGVVAIGTGAQGDATGKLKLASVQVSVVTVSGLPTCNGAAEGTIYAVSDATAPTYNATLTGGAA